MQFIPSEKKENEPTDAEVLEWIDNYVSIRTTKEEMMYKKIESLLSKQPLPELEIKEKQVAQVGDLIEIAFWSNRELFLLTHSGLLSLKDYAIYDKESSTEIYPNYANGEYKIIARAKDLKLVEEIGK